MTLFYYFLLSCIHLRHCAFVCTIWVRVIFTIEVFKRINIPNCVHSLIPSNNVYVAVVIFSSGRSAICRQALTVSSCVD